MINSGYLIDSVCKSYLVDGEIHVVLDNLSLEIDTRDITVVLGASGCGKTTLLRLIAYLEDVSSGKISFIKNGIECKSKVGFVFQESRLMDWLNVSENILFHRNREFKNKNNELDKYLDIMNLQKFKKAYPNELSGGMAQRVSIARALSFNPDILLMDEPFSSLDYFTRIDMQNEVIKVHETTDKGVVFVTHDIEEALKIGKKIIVFTVNSWVKEFYIDKSYTRDLTNEYFINLKKEILSLLKI